MVNTTNFVEEMKQQLAARGFKKVPVPVCVAVSKYVTEFYQKKVIDENGQVKYFINVEQYQSEGFEFEAVLYAKNTHAPCCIRMYAGWNLENVERSVETIYNCGEFEREDIDEYNR